ncbi:MAG: DUF2079 domain-containing protein, partial [Chloroflexi bacterium]|nr:DUF2079 domain-containing protein [Chloroflexota bacterium]
SDFHAVSLSACFILWVLYLAQQGRFLPYALLIFLALMAKEDVPLLVAAIGGHLFVCRGERRVGLLTVVAGLGWFALCMGVILPAFNGLGGSPFLPRLAIFGPTAEESFYNVLRQPMLLVQWLLKPEIVAYLGGLLASAGFLSLFAPSVLLLATPAIAMNVFSAWSWTYSGGDHYSITIVPFIIVAATYGLKNLAEILSRWPGVPYRKAVIGLSLWVLVIAGWHHHQIGVSPLAQTFYPPHPGDHHRLGKALMRQIPPEAPLSAQTNLYPHLSQREKAYLYPALNDAEYVLLDVTSSPYPLTPSGLYLSARQLLRQGDFGLLAAEDGYLLLQRGRSPSWNEALPASFYTFARAAGPPAYSLRARFGDDLELVGYGYRILSVVHAQHRHMTLFTYWRALRPLELDYHFAFFFTRRDGAIAFCYCEDTSATAWYPPYRWRPGEVVRLETPVLVTSRRGDALLAVTPPARDPWQVRDRLPVQRVADGREVEILQEGTLLRLGRFP